MSSPDDAVARVATRGQAAEAESVFAVDVSQHEGEVLSRLVDGGTARSKQFFKVTVKQTTVSTGGNRRSVLVPVQVEGEAELGKRLQEVLVAETR